MKLAEALILRADTQKRIEQLKSRIMDNIVVQDGEQPVENPMDLLKELGMAVQELEKYICSINRTNQKTVLEDGRTLAEVIVHREILLKKRDVLVNMIETASRREERYSMSEIRRVLTIDASHFVKEADQLAKEIRQWDIEIQKANWETDLILS